MKPMPRRQMLETLAGAMPLLGGATALFGAENPRRKRLGVCTYSYNIHWKAARDGHPQVRFKDTIEFLEYCHQLGAGGVQIGVGSKDPDYPKKLRAKAEAYEMYFEGQTGLPQQSSDVGNNIALLEEPMAVVEALAPFAFSTHLKDMAVQEYEEGFLLSEVPLGEGFLDLKKMVAVLQTSNPTIQFNLEMITRDPLKIPCLTKKYWATMEAVPAAQLAGALAMIRKNAATKPLPHTNGLDLDRQLALEDDNVKASFTYARERLGL